jgi:DNA-binding NarL/FixJ family response regulator
MNVQQPAPTTVVVADVHQIVREGVRRVLESNGDFEVVGEAGNDTELVRVVGELSPDIVLTEILSSCLYGIEPIRMGCEQGNATRYLVFSKEHRRDQLAEALRAGAAGYVPKTASTREIREALMTVRDGDVYLPKGFPAELEELNAKAPGQPTKRERDVLRRVAEGRSSGEIATELRIGRRTVDSHRSNLMRKLGFRKTAELVRYAVKHGIVSP